MKALVKFKKGPEGIELREVPEPIAREGEIKIRVKAAGICGTDIHIRNDEYPFVVFPVTIGHEYVGDVVEIGSGVKKFQPGDRVISITAKYTCGECVYCRKGAYMFCPERKSIGSSADGVMAEYVVLPEKIAYKIPANLMYGNELALCEPLACCVRGVLEKTAITVGDAVFISGPGTIGLLSLQLAKLAGARVIISGLEKDKKRLELAQILGVDAIAWTTEQAQEAVRELSPGGVDIAFECSGAEAAAKTCVEMLKMQGQYTQIALFGKEIPFNLDRFLYKELTLNTTFAHTLSTWDKVLEILKTGKINLRSLFDDYYVLDQWRDAFEKCEKQEGFKIAMRP
jgi:L-iditol 2-dehydrogenase